MLQTRKKFVIMSGPAQGLQYMKQWFAPRECDSDKSSVQRYNLRKKGDKTMKEFKTLSYVFAAVGVLLMLVACLERFILGSTVLGISPRAVMLGANTSLLLAILVYLYKKD
jgi:hypothetical protein